MEYTRQQVKKAFMALVEEYKERLADFHPIYQQYTKQYIEKMLKYVLPHLVMVLNEEESFIIHFSNILTIREDNLKDFPTLFSFSAFYIIAEYQRSENMDFVDSMYRCVLLSYTVRPEEIPQDLTVFYGMSRAFKKALEGRNMQTVQIAQTPPPAFMSIVDYLIESFAPIEDMEKIESIICKINMSNPSNEAREAYEKIHNKIFERRKKADMNNLYTISGNKIVIKELLNHGTINDIHDNDQVATIPNKKSSRKSN